jgi:hypothetical protein
LCWTLCTWDKWHLGKLVSPRGLWWTSTTKIDYRKWLSPFPFQSLPFWWLMPTQTKANIKCKIVTSLLFWLMCICYLDLNQLKDFVRMSKNKRDCFLLFKPISLSSSHGNNARQTKVKKDLPSSFNMWMWMRM